MSGLKASVSTEVVRFMSVFKGEVVAGSRGPLDVRWALCSLHIHAKMLLYARIYLYAIKISGLGR